MSDEWTYSEYWGLVASIGSDVLTGLLDGTVTDESDALHEAVDGTAWIIYYAGARAVMAHTENGDALFDEMGSEALDGVESWSEATTRAAFYAMRADVAAWTARHRDEYPGEADPDAVQAMADDAATAGGATWTAAEVGYIPRTDGPPDVVVRIVPDDAPLDVDAFVDAMDLPRAYVVVGALAWDGSVAVRWGTP